MALFTRNTGATAAVNVVLFACTAFLAAEPAMWLVRTWFDAALASHGEVVFLGVLALVAWSVSSARRDSGSNALPALLFGATAIVRVTGHVLDVDVIGALALVVDVYALGLMLGLKHRERALSPFWLAVLFGLALPLERIIQRVIGFGLQQISAAGACGALSVAFDDVVCQGTDIVLAGSHVLVDLPCSGARGLLLLGTSFAIVAALTRPSALWAAAGVATATLAALVANTIRIALLAIGIAFADTVGIDVMAQPWHDIVGLCCLALGLTAIVAWSKLAALVAPGTAQLSGATRPSELREPGRARLPIAAALLAACIAVSLAQPQPVDVGKPMESLEMPKHLAGFSARPLPLKEREREYFTTFGGAAAKSTYGERTLLLVSTSAPLRHLHAPEECLAGAGFDVERLGITRGALPGALYHAVEPNGREWRVVVTYRSDAGHIATSISQAVWLWLQHPETTWTAIERAHPWHADGAENERFDGAVRSALHLDTMETP